MVDPVWKRPLTRLKTANSILWNADLFSSKTHLLVVYIKYLKIRLYSFVCRAHVPGGWKVVLFFVALDTCLLSVPWSYQSSARARFFGESWHQHSAEESETIYKGEVKRLWPGWGGQHLSQHSAHPNRLKRSAEKWESDGGVEWESEPL